MSRVRARRPAACGTPRSGCSPSRSPGDRGDAVREREPIPGSAGTDTSLPADRLGRHGQRPGSLRRPRDHGEPDGEPDQPGDLDHLDRRRPRRMSGPRSVRWQLPADHAVLGRRRRHRRPDNPGPPPEQCVPGRDRRGVRRAALRCRSRAGYDPRRGSSRGRDWPSFDAADGFLDETTGFVWRPFRAVDGTEVERAHRPDLQPVARGWQLLAEPLLQRDHDQRDRRRSRPARTARGAELFEVHDRRRVVGLGCGQKVQPVAGGRRRCPKCWIVIVPRATPADENVGTPFEASRPVRRVHVAAVAVRVAATASPSRSSSTRSTRRARSSDEERRIAGTELRAPRGRQLAAGAVRQRRSAAVLLRHRQRLRPPGSSCVSGVAGRAGHGRRCRARSIRHAVDADQPGRLRAAQRLRRSSIGFNIERNPQPGRSPRRTRAAAGVRVAELNLTPRLVAKLLTQSYRLPGRRSTRCRPLRRGSTTNPAPPRRRPRLPAVQPRVRAPRDRRRQNFGGLVLPAPGTPTRRSRCGSGSSPTRRPGRGWTVSPTSGA